MNDGGPAFPWEQTVGNQDNLGLSKRDWFAGMALQGMLCNGFMPNQYLRGGNTPDWDYVTASYAMADAMLKERSK